MEHNIKDDIFSPLYKVFLSANYVLQFFKMSKETEQCCFVIVFIICLLVLAIVCYIEDIFLSFKSNADT